MLRKVLIVDDSDINRKLLERLLGDEYAVLEAANGREALEILSCEKSVSAVLLDIIMPEMNGYEVLEKIRGNPDTAQIPVIITTGNTEEASEVHALSLGANDYITKPYSSSVVLHRLRNTINLRETASAVNAMMRDKLTGLLNREAFFEKVEEMVAEHEPGHYVLSCMDIDSFKVINDQYGLMKGDEVLKHVAAAFERGFDKIGGVCCRIIADNFAVLYPTTFLDSDKFNIIRQEASTPGESIPQLTISTGRYIITDTDLPVSAMYDRAMLAQHSVKGRFDVHVAMYDESMRQQLLHEQEIINEMNAALQERQFVVWFQPQYNHSSGALVGAEALVRWHHPVKGVISPNGFIPVFERNGFVYELDKYVWESVCACLRRWLDAGRFPLPVSVNVSRYDVFRSDFYDVIIGLVEKYDVPVELLRIEITESAFAKSGDQIISMVRRLTDYGFTVEIDDFGSGYSSFNTLKDVPATILKLDMQFLKSGDNSQRGGNILESIIRMAEWLGMPVIAEGVETREQADFLRSIGCNYVQGYFYARPMPVEEYEALEDESGKEKEMIALETVEQLDNNAFWDPASMETLIFNSYVGGACIFEYHSGELTLLRANEKYAQELYDSATASNSRAMMIKLPDYMDEKNLSAVYANIHRAIETGQESTCEVMMRGFAGKEHNYIRTTVRVIARTKERYLFYCSIINMTAQREAELRVLATSQRMKAIMDNVSSGITATVFVDGRIDYIFANDRFYRMLGYTHRQFKDEIGENFLPLHPDDREWVTERVRQVNWTGESAMMEFRAIRRDGREIWLQCSISLTQFVGVNDAVQISIITDVTESKGAHRAYQEMLPIVLAAMMSSSSDLSFVKDSEFKYICCSAAFAKMVGLESELHIIGKTDFDIFDAPLAEQYRADDIKLVQGGEALVDYVEALPAEGGATRYSSTSKYLLYDAAGNVIGLYGTGRDITEDRAAYAQLKLLTDNIPGGLATYECKPSGLRITYYSDGFCKLVGHTREEYDNIAKSNAVSQVFEDDKLIITEQMRALLSGADSVNCDYRIHIPNDGYKWINLRGMVAERRGDTVIVHAALLDVTERKQAEEKLRMSEEQYRLAQRHSGNIMCRYDVADRSITMSAETAALFGKPQKVSNVPYDPVMLGTIAPESADTYITFYENILNGSPQGTAEFKALMLGQWHWLKADYSTIFSDDGEPVYAVISFADVTERREASEELERVSESERALQLVAAHSSRLIYRYDIVSHTAYTDTVRPGWKKLLSLNTGLPESAIAEGCILPESIDDYRGIFKDMESGAPSGDVNIHMFNDNGQARWVNMKYSLIRMDDGTSGSAVVSFLDITESHEKALAYERYRQTIEQDAAAGGGVVFLETDITTDIMEKCGGNLVLAGHLPSVGSTRAEMINRIAENYVEKDSREKCYAFFSRERLITEFEDGVRSISEDWPVVMPDAQHRWFRSEIQMIQDPYSGHIRAYTILRDVTDEKLAALEVEKKAETDGVTGLYNKATAEAMISGKLAGAAGGACALMIADLDNLKAINDNLGHPQGDAAIKQFADALRAQFRRTDIIGRIGGDEFVVYLEGVNEEGKLSSIMSMLTRKLADIRLGPKSDVLLHASIGVASGTVGKDTFAELYKRSDKALYYVKRHGKNGFAIYSPTMK